ncbi:hypothetical protein RCL1_003378 [Eukaryota sp. TZLM3-RCL]
MEVNTLHELITALSSSSNDVLDIILCSKELVINQTVQLSNVNLSSSCNTTIILKNNAQLFLSCSVFSNLIIKHYKSPASRLIISAPSTVSHTDISIPVICSTDSHVDLCSTFSQSIFRGSAYDQAPLLLIERGKVVVEDCQFRSSNYALVNHSNELKVINTKFIGQQTTSIVSFSEFSVLESMFFGSSSAFSFDPQSNLIGHVENCTFYETGLCFEIFSGQLAISHSNFHDNVSVYSASEGSKVVTNNCSFTNEKGILSNNSRGFLEFHHSKFLSSNLCSELISEGVLFQSCNYNRCSNFLINSSNVEILESNFEECSNFFKISGDSFLSISNSEIKNNCSFISSLDSNSTINLINCSISGKKTSELINSKAGKWVIKQSNLIDLPLCIEFSNSSIVFDTCTFKNFDQFFKINSSDVEITGSSFSDSKLGLIFSHCHSVSIKNSVFSSTPTNFLSSKITLENSTFTRSTKALSFQSCSIFGVNVMVQNCQDGLLFSDCLDNSLLSDLSISNCDLGLFLNNSEIKLSKSSIKSSKIAGILENSSNLIVEEVVFSDLDNCLVVNSKSNCSCQEGIYFENNKQCIELKKSSKVNFSNILAQNCELFAFIDSSSGIFLSNPKFINCFIVISPEKGCKLELEEPIFENVGMTFGYI